MRAAVCHEFRAPLVVEEIELAPPAACHVSVRVTACGICHSDISYLDGAWGGSLPAVYGHEVAGVVTAIGPEVEGVDEGSRAIVTGVRYCGRCYFCTIGRPALCETHFPTHGSDPLRSRSGKPIQQGLRVGGFAEAATVHQSQVVAIPPDVALESACLLACAVITGIGAVVNDARVQPGQSVVVVGCGGVGLNSVQGARLACAQPIVAVDVSQEKLEAVLGFGATHAVDAREGDARQAVLALTNGRGADHVIITAGTKDAVEEALGLVRRGGTLVVVGMPASGVRAAFDPSELAHNAVRIVGSKFGSVRPHIDIPWLLGLYRAGRLKLDELVSGRYPLDQINEALDSVRRGGALRNVIVP